LSGNTVIWNPKVFKMEIDGLRNMTFQIVRERRSHIDYPHRGVIDESFQLARFNKPGMIKPFDRERCGKEGGRKQKKEGQQGNPEKA
jgi:hypothetical protein